MPALIGISIPAALLLRSEGPGMTPPGPSVITDGGPVVSQIARQWRPGLSLAGGLHAPGTWQTVDDVVIAPPQLPATGRTSGRRTVVAARNLTREWSLANTVNTLAQRGR